MAPVAVLQLLLGSLVLLHSGLCHSGFRWLKTEENQMENIQQQGLAEQEIVQPSSERFLAWR